MTVFSDDFTGTDGDPLEGRTGWTLTNGTAAAAKVNASNQLRCSIMNADSVGGGYTAPDTGSADHYAQAVQKSDTSFSFICVRLTDSNNFIGYRYTSGVHQAFKRVAGTFTSLGSLTQAFDATAVMRPEASGTDITVKKNGTAILGPFTVTNFSTVQTPGLAARAGLVDPWLDDWESGPLAGGGTTYSDTLSESITVADSLANAVTFTNALGESVTLADALAAAATLPNALAESITLSDQFSNGNVYTDTLSESLTLADSLAAKATFPNTLSEALSLADSLTSAASFAALLSEAVSLTDSYASTGGSQNIWTAIAEAAGTWTPVSPASGTWTPVI